MLKIKDHNVINWNDVLEENHNSRTGLVWKINVAAKRIGDVAGCFWKDKKLNISYLKVGFNGKSWQGHRIIWIMRNGYVGEDEIIDHIDGNALNNSPENLRKVKIVFNSRNRKMQTNNATGKNGVSIIKNKDKTHAVARWYDENGKQKGKWFSCDKLGQEVAFELACKYRDEMLNVLNNKGHNYSDRHGI